MPLIDISRKYEESYLRRRSKRTLPVTLITGSLGSGKTTLLRDLISRKGLSFKCGAIVNDFAEMNLDADVARISSDRVMELSNGCVCCDLANDLRAAVWKVLKSVSGENDDDDGESSMFDVDYLLVETSGVSDPADIVMMLDECFGKMTRVVLESVVTVVDVDKIVADGGVKDDVVASSQLRHADVILMNKIDLLENEEASSAQAMKLLRSISPDAILIPCTYCKVLLTKILPVRIAESEREASGRAMSKRERENNIEYVLPHDLLESKTYGRKGTLRRREYRDDDHHHRRHKNPNGSVCFETETMLSLERFQRLVYAVRNGETPTVLRMKGIIMFKTCPSVFYEFHLSGSTKRQRVQLLRLENPPSRSKKTRIVAIGPGLCVKKNRDLMSHLLQDCTGSTTTTTTTSSSWQLLIHKDERFDVSPRGMYFRFAVPKGLESSRNDLSTRYGVDFDTLLEEYVRRVNMTKLPILILLCKLLDDDECDDETSALYAVSSCPLGYDDEKSLLDLWCHVASLSSIPIQRMKRQIPSCRCGQ
jgi:G3E family GTPase